MTNHPDSRDHMADVATLLQSPPAIRDRDFSRQVMQQAQHQFRRRALFISSVWALALTGLIIVLLGLGVDNTLTGFLQQAGAMVAELNVVSDINLTTGLELVADPDLSLLQNTGLLALAGAAVLVVVFATASLLD